MSDKFGEGRDPYLYPGLDIMRNRLNIHQQQRLEQAAYEMTALRAATIELGPLVRGLPAFAHYPSPAVSGYFRLGGATA
ncbi:Cell filamentation protein fic [Escherichia coli EC4100B]|nr:Cell filamentation protein fic [Escherichia coli EC4100B]